MTSNKNSLEDFKHQMRDYYTEYASYVILQRAIPNVVDGLKPVQRRVLYTLQLMDQDKLFHKVVNVAGRTMAYHPHGDAPITEAIVALAVKDFLLDQQGNFGNLFTGDPAAAGRYIETRLTPLARETLFNPDLTRWAPSYDSRHQEPICLPAKIPVVLLQGADGIAVGMSTHIFPHNFKELLEAEIAILENKSFQILPDFPTGGIMDASQYNDGKGKIKLRAKIEVKDPKTLIIKEICYGTTTETLIRSIDEAAKKGRIKIEEISDYTAEKIEIEIKLPRGGYAQDLLDSLYAYTECEVSLSSQIIVIKDDYPWEPTISELLHFYTQQLKHYLTCELEIEAANLREKIFDKTLEQIFIENRLYKYIEDLDSYEKIHQTMSKDLAPFHDNLLRVPTHDDREKLLNIPLRRISRFDIKKNQGDIDAFQEQLMRAEKDLKNITKFSIRYLQNLIKKYAISHERKTEVQKIEQINTRAMETRQVKVGFDAASGFIGTKVASDRMLECTNFDKLLLLFKDGTYTVLSIPEKHYVHHKGTQVIYIGIADKTTVFSTVFRDPKTKLVYAKKFIIDKFLLDKMYRYFEEEMVLEFISTQTHLELELQLVPTPRQKIAKLSLNLDHILVKNATAKGVRLTPREVKKVIPLKI